EVRELQGGQAAQPAARDLVEDREVARGRGLGVDRRDDVLAEVRDRRAEAARVEPGDDGERLVGRPPRDEATHEPARERQAIHGGTDRRALGQREQERAEGHGTESVTASMIPSRNPYSLTTSASTPSVAMVAATIAVPGMMRSARPGSRQGSAPRSS